MNTDWGKEFIKSEVITVDKIPKMKEWTLSAWFRTPLPDGQKILAQGGSGTGAIVGANNDYFFTIDQNTGAEVILWSGISKLKKTWHHIAVVMKEEMEITAYINGTAKNENKKSYFDEAFKYFGNSRKGKNPFGVISDLRVYRRCLEKQEIKGLAIRNINLIDGLPDKYCEYANTYDMPSVMIEMIKKERDIVRTSALQAISSMATKSSCRSSMLRNAIVSVLIDSIISANPLIRKHAAKCLVNLG